MLTFFLGGYSNSFARYGQLPESCVIPKLCPSSCATVVAQSAIKLLVAPHMLMEPVSGQGFFVLSGTRKSGGLWVLPSGPFQKISQNSFGGKRIDRCHHMGGRCFL